MFVSKTYPTNVVLVQSALISFRATIYRLHLHNPIGAKTVLGWNFPNIGKLASCSSFSAKLDKTTKLSLKTRLTGLIAKLPRPISVLTGLIVGLIKLIVWLT